MKNRFIENSVWDCPLNSNEPLSLRRWQEFSHFPTKAIGGAEIPQCAAADWITTFPFKFSSRKLGRYWTIKSNRYWGDVWIPKASRTRCWVFSNRPTTLWWAADQVGSGSHNFVRLFRARPRYSSNVWWPNRCRLARGQVVFHFELPSRPGFHTYAHLQKDALLRDGFCFIFYESFCRVWNAFGVGIFGEEKLVVCFLRGLRK